MEKAGVAGRPPRVLLAEDQDMLREMVSDHLSAAGYEVTVAKDGNEALRLALELGPYDLLVVDEDMPGLTGRRLLARLRAEGFEVPALLWSGHLELSDEERAGLGVRSVLGKPLELRLLEQAVRDVLERPGS